MMKSMQSAAAFIACLILVTGCSSIGVRYVSADDVPDAAEIVDSEGTLINSVNEKGCYSGRTSLGKSFKLQPGQQVVLTQESNFRGAQGSDMFCRALVAFTPQPSKRYRVRGEILTVKDAGKNLFGQSVDGNACKLNVLELSDDGRSIPVATEPRVLRQTALTCIRFVNPAVEDAEGAS